MEEKERYEIHIYDDICVDLYDNGVLDNSINDTYKLEELLNQQSKRIKELEETNKELEIKLDKCGTELVNAENLVSYLENENKQLKQQLVITEKALELACETLQDINFKLYNTEMNFVDFFKQQAKERLENE